jgi:gliding motility-associated-like protein
VIVIKASNGCAAIKTITITQNSIKPTVTIVNNEELTCSTTSITLDAGDSTGQGELSYSWNTGATTSTIDVNTPGTYSVTVNDVLNGCSNTSEVLVSQNITQPEVIIEGNEELTCTTTSVTLDASQTVVSGDASYVWSTGATSSSIQVDVAGEYSVTVIDSENGCSATSIVNVIGVCEEDPIDPTPPTIIVTGNDILTCIVNSVTLDASESYGIGELTFLWSTGETTSTITVVEAGSYSVIITDTYNNESSEEVVFVVQNIDTPTAVISGNIGLTCSSNNIILDASSSTVQGDASYLWSTGATSATLEVMEAGVYSVTVTDSESGCSDITEITVSDNCTFAIDDINNTFIDMPVVGNVLTNDFDEEGDVQTVTTTTVTTSEGVIVTIDASTGVYMYTPPAGFIGTDSFEYTVCDNGDPQACDTAIVTIEVLDVTNGNHPPVANNDTSTTEENTPVDGNLLVNDFDPNGDTITVNTTPIENPSNGTVVINSDGTYTYTPNDGFIGEDTFTYEICDNGDPVLCDTATVVITILPNGEVVNHTNANDDAYNGGVNTILIGNVLDNDTDPEGDTQTVNTIPLTDVVNGVLVLNSDGSFTYTPNDGFVGTDSFVYEVCDNGDPVACDTATVVITVNPSNCSDFEISVTVTSETCQGTNGSATVDVSGAREPLNYVWSNGQTTETATGLVEGLYTVTVTDANGCETTTEVTINFEGTHQELEVDNVLVLCVLDSSINLITDEMNGLSSLVDNFVTGGTWSDNQNSGGLSGDFFDPSIVNLGDYELTYEEPGDCGRIITLFVSVNDDCVVRGCETEGSIEISKVVTANNDGVNDFFTISEIASCGFTAEVTIFNRWGKVVYQSNNYQNDWGGYHDNSGLTMGTNNKLPAGTYYYVVNIIGSGYRPITGYIYLGTN